MWGRGLIWLRISKVTGSCERGDEHSGSIKCKEFLHYVKYQQLAYQDAPCSM
jgi:hypothetical protein